MILSSLIAKAQCHFWGHKRMRRVGIAEKATPRGMIKQGYEISDFECPRCGHIEAREVKQRQPKQPATKEPSNG